MAQTNTALETLTNTTKYKSQCCSVSAAELETENRRVADTILFPPKAPEPCGGPTPTGTAPLTEPPPPHGAHTRGRAGPGPAQPAPAPVPTDPGRARPTREDGLPRPGPAHPALHPPLPLPLTLQHQPRAAVKPGGSPRRLQAPPPKAAALTQPRAPHGCARSGRGRRRTRRKGATPAPTAPKGSGTRRDGRGPAPARPPGSFTRRAPRQRSAPRRPLGTAAPWAGSRGLMGAVVSRR